MKESFLNQYIIEAEKDAADDKGNFINRHKVILSNDAFAIGHMIERLVHKLNQLACKIE